MVSFVLFVKKDIESVMHFFFDRSYFRHNFESLRNKMRFQIVGSNPTDGVYICNFIENLDGHNKVLLPLRGLAFSFDNGTNILIKRFISSAVGKIHKLRNEGLRELEALWLVNQSPVFIWLVFCYLIFGTFVSINF